MAVQCIDIPLEAKVSEAITNVNWNQHTTNLQESDLKERILAITINQYLEKDEIVWVATPLGRFSSKSAYDSIFKPRNRVR